MPRTASRTTLKRKADKLWSELIRLKVNCEICSKPANNPHHVIGRRNLTLRHDPRNGVLLCALHHTFGRESAHQDPVWFIYWMMKNRRKDYNYLMLKRMELAVKVDYDAVLRKLKETFKSIIT